MKPSVIERVLPLPHSELKKFQPYKLNKSIKKILFIHVGNTTPEYHLVTPPLGIMYLSSYLKSKIENLETSIIDMMVYNLDAETVAKMTADFEPDLIGISVITPNSYYLAPVVHELKKVLPQIPLVIGGAHATSIMEKVFFQLPVDFSIIGEGEEVFYSLVKALNEGQEFRDFKVFQSELEDPIFDQLKKIKGLIFPSGKSLYINSGVDYIENLDNLPFPDWDAIDIEGYKEKFSFSYHYKKKHMPLFTSRGCPFKCTYCHDNFGKSFRFRSAKNVVNEMEVLVKEYGISNFEIIDDIFNFNKKRVLDICEAIIERKLKVRLSFPNGIRGDILDENVLDSMKQAGVDSLNFAIETATPELQKKIKKHVNLKNIEKNINYASKIGIFCHGFFMIGFPGETKEQILNTINYATNLKLHMGYFFIVTPFEGTELYNSLEGSAEKRATVFTSQRSQYGQANCSELSNKELYRLQGYANLKFYLNPIRIFRILKDYPRGIRCFVAQTIMFFKRVFVRPPKNKKVSSNPSSLNVSPIKT